MYSLLFTDDQVVTARSREDAKYMIRKPLEAFEVGLRVNMNKTEYLVIGGGGKDIILPQGTIKAVMHFKYLGSVIHESGSCNADVDRRIFQARSSIKMPKQESNPSLSTTLDQQETESAE